MNTPRLKPGFGWMIVAVFCLALAADVARAATGTWTGVAGATWDTSANNWSGVTDPAWDEANGTNNTATFNTAGATPSVSGSVYVNKVVFGDTATVSGGTIVLGKTATANPVITNAANVTINATLNNTAAATANSKYGAGTLVLAGNNSLKGLSVAAGKVVMTYTNTFSRPIGVSAGAELVVTNGAVLTTASDPSSVSGTLRVNGGTATIGANSTQCLIINSGGLLAIESGTLQNTSYGRPMGIRGTVNLSGGEFKYQGTSGYIYLGHDLSNPGTGVIIQSNGVFNSTYGSTYGLYIGWNNKAAGSVGTYTMVGGTQTWVIGVTIAQSSSGSGKADGTLTISNAVGVAEPVANIPTLNLGAGASAQGTLNLAAGTLRVNTLSSSGDSTYPQTFNFSGGTLSPYNANATIGSATPAANTTITLTGTNGVISSSDKDGTKRTVSIWSKLTGSGAVTFTGSGTNIVIAANNDYTGNTTVNGDTVVWSNACLSANADLICTNSPKLSLQYSDTNTIRSLIVNGAMQNPAVYSAGNVPAGISIVGPGALRVTTGGVSSGTVIHIR
jgi:hypothetical protein